MGESWEKGSWILTWSVCFGESQAQVFSNKLITHHLESSQQRRIFRGFCRYFKYYKCSNFYKKYWQPIINLKYIFMVEWYPRS